MAGPRSIVFIPRDTWISGTNTSSKDIHMTAIFSRPGFEKYMRARLARNRVNRSSRSLGSNWRDCVPWVTPCTGIPARNLTRPAWPILNAIYRQRIYLARDCRGQFNLFRCELLILGGFFVKFVGDEAATGIGAAGHRALVLIRRRVTPELLGALIVVLSFRFQLG